MKNIYKIVSLAFAVSAVLASCRKDMDEEFGYIKMELNTLESAVTAKSVMGAPVGYNPNQLYVEIVDDNDKVVLSTSDFANDAKFKEVIRLTPGTYVINAHSYGWDGSDSGFEVPFYAGSATAVVKQKELKNVKLTCTLANVKVTVNYDNSFKTYFKNATTSVTSLLEGVAGREFKMNATTSPAYFPVGDLALMLAVVNNSNVSHAQFDTVKNVQPRQWVKINYTVAAPGTLGGVTVKIDEATRTYEFNLAVPRKPGISFECFKPQGGDVWSRFVNLKGEITSKTAEFDANDGPSKIVFQWREKGASEWNDIANELLTRNGDVYTYTLKGLTADTEYELRMHYPSDDPIDSDVVTFTTGKELQIYNPGFEYWYTDGKIQYPDESGVSYWNTSNPGSADYIGSVTVKETGFKHSGSACAKLQTQYAVIKLAAGSMYTGNFKGLIGTKGAKLDWGVPFTCRPTSLKGWLSYTPGSINRGTQPSGVGAPDKNANDHCSIFCALLTQQLHVGGNAESNEYENSTKINWQTDSRVIAYGELDKSNSSGNQWEAFEIPLVYHNMSAIPSHLLIVCSSSKWGDFFYGSDTSVLYVDDLELSYTDSPVKQ